MKFGITICFFVTTLCYAQNEALFEIINSDSNLELRQKKIDSLITASKQNLPPIQLGYFYHDLASKWFFNNWWNVRNQRDLEKAIFYTDKALKLKKGQDGLEEGSLEKTWYNLGYYHFIDGDVYKAIDIYKSLIKNGKGNLVQKANLELGISYAFIGDFYKALERFNEYTAYYRAKDNLDTKGNLSLFSGYLSKAETYAQMGFKVFSEEIQTHLVSADSILKKIDGADNLSFNMVNQLDGNRLLKTGNYTRAIELYKKVLKDSVSLDAHNLAVVYNSLALSQLKLREYKKALSNLNKAIIYDLNYTDPYENLGDLYLDQNEFEKGLFYYQKAIVYATDKSKEIRYGNLPKIKDLELAIDKNKLLNHIVTKANGWVKYFKYGNNIEHLTQALETFTLADQLVDLIRFESTEQQSKLYWREQGATLYMKAVEVCYLLNKPQEAYHFMERNKALLLLEDLTNEEAKEIAQLPNEAAKREFNLKRKIHLSENSLAEADESNQEIIGHLKDTIRENKYRYEQFVDSLNEAYPDYAKFKKKVDILSYSELKANYLSGEQAVLHYILNEDQGYGLLTSADTTLLFKLENPSKLNWDIEVLIHMLSNGASDQETFNALAHTLFENLIPEKVYDEIKGKQLTIIPDYTLQRIPFETLVVDKTLPKYLLEEVEIGYVYSMSLLDRTKRSDREPTKDLLGVAPVQFGGLGLAELNFSKGEIAGIANVFEGDVFLNGQASKANFIEQVGDHKIIHLSTHADMGDGDNPWIAFSDSKMYLKEIYATKNQSDMVVLSACNTSNGNLKRGEGLMSLARGFFYSGAKSVVSSLWPITDDTGQEVMIDFYKNLAQGFSKTKALRKAKLTYLENTEEVELKHPFYWAGFVVVGDNAPVASGPYWYWILLGIAVLALLVFIFRRRLFLLRKG